MTVPTSLITVEPVCRCYLRTDSLLKLLGESVPFLKVILEKPEFIKLLGVESQATAEAMLRHLDALSRSSDLSVSKIVVRHSAVEPLTRRSAGLATHVSGPRIGTADGTVGRPKAIDAVVRDGRRPLEAGAIDVWKQSTTPMVLHALRSIHVTRAIFEQTI